MRPPTTRIDTARWLKELREWGGRHEGMRALTRALERIHGPEEAGLISKVLVERLLIRALAAHEGRLTASSTRIEEILNRLMEDREALRGGGRPVRPGAEQTSDLRQLERHLQGLETFEQTVREMINDSEHGWQTALRNDLETQLGLTRSLAPVTGASEIARLMALANPPRLRPGTRPELVAAANELLDALHMTPPAPVAPPEGRPYKASERVGTQSERVTEAASRMVALLGGEKAGGVPGAVRLILAGAGDVAERDRMVFAVLVAHQRLMPGTSVPKSGSMAAAGNFQESVSGSSQEWTGRLMEPVRGHTTIGIDNLVGGWVRDPKYTNVTLSESGHLKGGVSSADGRVAGFAAQEERIRIKVTSQLERQLRFAQENGLRGVEWMTDSLELADAFERIWAEEVRPAVPGVPARFLVVTD